MNLILYTYYFFTIILGIHSKGLPHWFLTAFSRDTHKNAPNYHQNNQNNNRNNHNRQNFLNFRLQKLNNTKCNDGSRAGYYIRQSNNRCIKKWLIFLEGGWYCYDKSTCGLRSRTNFDLTSSLSWSSRRQFSGILSRDKAVNPGYHDYNFVYIPYCSGDLWSGMKWEKTEGSYFHGSRILDSVIDDLSRNRRFKKVEDITLVGASAGGIGVMLNIDRLVKRTEKRLGRKIPISGIMDSAWFFNQKPFVKTNKCFNIYHCPPDIAIKKGMKLWTSRIPRRCRKKTGDKMHWKCFMASVIYPLIKSPVFVIQSLFDNVQLSMSKAPFLEGGDSKKLEFIHRLGKRTRKKMKKANGVFAQSCVDHEILTKNNWASLSVDHQTLDTTLYYWRLYLDYKFYKLKQINIQYFKARRRGNKKSGRKVVRRNRRRNCCKRSKSHRKPMKPNASLYRLIDSCRLTQLPNSTQLHQNSTLPSSSLCYNGRIPLLPFCNPSCRPIVRPQTSYKLSFINLLDLYKFPYHHLYDRRKYSKKKLLKMTSAQQMVELVC